MPILDSMIVNYFSEKTTNKDMTIVTHYWGVVLFKSLALMEKENVGFE